jgi:hypothetical protein
MKSYLPVAYSAEKVAYMASPSFISKLCLSAVALAATGCGGASGTSSALPASPSSHVIRTGTKPPPPCVPTVWASSLSSNAVYGFTAPTSAPCVTLTGPYNGLNINAPIAVAISKHPKVLYVADLNNDRILVFNYAGVFIKWWSTGYGGQTYQPWGVCVSPKGLVGVANRQFNNTGPPGNVEFFVPTAASGSGPTGEASGIFIADQWCAFDRVSNFFVDGTTSGGQVIAYLARAFVGLNGQTLVNSGLGSGAFWVGMYSRINNPANDTLSVGTSVGLSTTQTIDNWKVAGPAAGPLVFTAIGAYSLTSYPSTTDAVYQLAPSLGGANGLLYVADYGASQTLYTTNNGGAVALYNNVNGTVGVAVRPSGQY